MFSLNRDYYSFNTPLQRNALTPLLKYLVFECFFANAFLRTLEYYSYCIYVLFCFFVFSFHGRVVHHGNDC